MCAMPDKERHLLDTLHDKVNDEVNLNATSNEVSDIQAWRLWLVEDVATTLKRKQFSKDIIRKLRKNSVDGRRLSNLKIEDLEDILEIKDFREGLRIWNFVTELREIQPQEYKIFNDPVHGTVKLHPLCVAIIDTPQFQRLRNIKQLGGVYYVYPGASHNRFEHSIGVCHLAGQLIKSLREQQPELDISHEEVLCVQIAGLCHDLGHGPFSHLFDKLFIPLIQSNQEGKWKHEHGSLAMFDYLYNDPKNNLMAKFDNHGLGDKKYLELIKDLIIGKGNSSKKSFLYEIVANKTNEIDVDKWDYFARDCYYLGMNCSFDHNRLIQFARVIQGEDNQLHVCFRDKEAFNVYQMFNTRLALHRRAYQHKTVKIVEQMLIDAMVAANDVLMVPGSTEKDGKRKKVKISDCINPGNVDAFVNLTDNIVDRILLKTDPRLEKAQRILRDLQCRKLYVLIGETPPTASGRYTQEDSIKTQILQYMVPPDRGSIPSASHNEDDVFVQIVKFDFGDKTSNPVDKVGFYSKNKHDRSEAVKAQQVSQLLPHSIYEEHVVRLLLKPSGNDSLDSQRKRSLREAFTKWLNKELRNSGRENYLQLSLTKIIINKY